MAKKSATSRRKQPPKRSTRRPVWLVPAAVVAACAGLIIFLVVDGDDEPATLEERLAAQVEQRVDGDARALGPVDAPVGLVVYSDYQCPFCAAWAEETLPVMREYADEGQLRIEWRDIGILGDASERAAVAASAAARQGQFWDYHDALFLDGEPRDEVDLSDDALVELAGELGIDTGQFRDHLTDVETLVTVDSDAQEAAAVGVTSTPAFVLAGQPIIGAQPTGVFVDALEAALDDEG